MLWLYFISNTLLITELLFGKAENFLTMFSKKIFTIPSHTSYTMNFDKKVQIYKHLKG